MSLSTAQVRHIAKLCRLTLSEEEVLKYAKELTSILAFIEELGKVNTDGVEPTVQVTGLHSRLRDDVLRGGEEQTDPDALLACSGLPIVDHMIETPHAHDQ